MLNSTQLRGDADSLRRHADHLDQLARERGGQDALRFKAQANGKRAQANELDDRAHELQRAEFLAELAR
jgi:hypothetical protein